MTRIIVIVVLLLATQSCAIFDGYKDNQHSWYAKELTPDEKRTVDQGKVLRKKINTPHSKGELLIMKGNRKYGQYNFVETGDWTEQYQYSSAYQKGKSYDKVTYDEYGNILKRQITETGEDAAFVNQIWTSELAIFDTDTVLTQKIVWFNNREQEIAEVTLAILNYKEMLSDRLKTKIKVGTEKKFDATGKLISEKTYRYNDKIKYR
jgi:hypothetical protein